MGNRFNAQCIRWPMAYLVLTSLMAIALGLGSGNRMGIAQSQTVPVVPADGDETAGGEAGEREAGDSELVDNEANVDPNVINPDDNTEDLGLEIESPIDSDSTPTSVEDGGLEGGGLEGGGLEELDGEGDRPELDAPENTVEDTIEDNIPQLLDALEDIEPSEIPSEIPSELEPDAEINLDNLQIDDLNEALEEDIVPPLVDILENGVEIQIDPPDAAPATPVPLPPRPARPPSGRPPAFGGTPLFENAVLTPNFMANPTIVRGISGGPLTASQVAGRAETVTGICTGFVDREPDHQIELTAFFDYLSLQVESPADTVLVVRGPGGSWCNDDVIGFNPGLAGEWFSGTYDIWIGSYNADTYHPYIIRFTDIQTGN